jgi:hypothetical protein
MPQALEELRAEAEYEPSDGGSGFSCGTVKKIIDRFLELFGNLKFPNNFPGKPEDLPPCTANPAGPGKEPRGSRTSPL